MAAPAPTLCIAIAPPLHLPITDDRTCSSSPYLATAAPKLCPSSCTSTGAAPLFLKKHRGHTYFLHRRRLVLLGAATLPPELQIGSILCFLLRRTTTAIHTVPSTVARQHPGMVSLLHRSPLLSSKTTTIVISSEDKSECQLLSYLQPINMAVTCKHRRMLVEAKGDCDLPCQN